MKRRCHLADIAPGCWELHEKLARARRTAENAEYAYYSRGIWPKGKTRAEVEAGIRAKQEKARAIEREMTQRGC